MAKKISKSDIFGDDLFKGVNQDAALLLKNIDDILLATKENLKAMKEYMLTWKSTNSSSIKELNATMAQSGKLIEVNNKLTKEQLRVEQQLQKTLEQTNKTKISANRLIEQEAKAAAKALKERTALNSIYSQESKRLNDLRNQYKNLALSEGESSKQAKNLLRDITALDNKLKTVDNTVGQNQRNVGNYGSALKGLGSSILAATGVGVGVSQAGQFLTQSLDDYKQFDKQLKDVAAITGLAGEELLFFKEAALQAGKTSQTSASDYLEAVKLIGSASPELLKNKESLKQVTDQALVLAEASGIDLPTAAGALTASLNQFQLPASQAKRVINALAAGSKEGSAEVGDLSEAFKNVGTVANDANISFEQTTALLEVLAERQLKGAEAGTKLRGSIAQLQKAGLGFKSGKFNIAEALKEAETQLNSIQDPAKRAQASIKLFGVENQVAGSILLQSQKRFKELTVAVTGTNTAYEQAAVQNESAAAKSKRLNNELQALRIEMGEKLLPVQIAYQKAVIATLTPLQSYQEELEQLIPIFGQVTAAMENNQVAVEALVMQYATGEKSINEVVQAVTLMGDAYKALEGSTAQTQKDGKALIEQFLTGKITLEEFQKAALKLRDQELGNRSGVTKIAMGGINAKLKKDESKEIQAINAETSAKAQKLKDDEYNALIKSIELEKTLNETAAERSIKNEEEKQIALQDANVSYLQKKLAIDTEYNKEFEKTELDYVRAQIALFKLMNKEKVDDTIKTKEELAKLALDLEELEAEQQANADQYVLNAQEKKDREEAERLQKNLELRKEIINKTIDLIEQEVERENQLKEDAIDKRIDDRENEIERQQELAAKGLDNQLAFEKARLAQDQLAKKQLQEKEIRQQKLMAFFKSYAAYAEKDPSTAITNALRDVALANIVSAAFFDGTEKVENDLKGNSNVRDGYVVRVDGSERVLTGDQNKMIGNLSNEELASLAKDYNNGTLLPSYVMNSPSKLSSENQTAAVISQGLKEVQDELKSVRAAIQNKPENKFEFDKFGNYIHEKIEAGFKRRTIFAPTKKRL
jgi:TP901 family phage tail tape measure protein